MSESAKTGIIAALAAVTALAAWSTTTRNFTTLESNASARVNQALFEKFTDPLDAASLKIVKYNNDAEQYEEFEVAKDSRSGVWTLPSNENYPADANKQMSDAANLFVGMKVLNVASEKRDEHKLFGVLEPDKKKEAEGGEGVGMLVQLRNSKGDSLVDLIIGKEDAQDNKKRFVRVPSEDVTYVAEITTTPLSTDFKQWIESDLLKLSANDIETLGIRNYSLLPTNQNTLELVPNYDADISYNVRDAKWNAKSMTVYAERRPSPKTLDESEELNSNKLNEMKNALDNLRIVNVARKPTGVAADLKGEQLGDETKAALQRRGFFAQRSASGDAYEIFSMNGDLQVTLKDGVQYLLRFGKGAGASFEPESEEAGEDGQKKVSINRFLMVTTRVDDSKFPEPELDRVPETVEELKALEAAKKAALAPKPAPQEPMPQDPASPEPAPPEPAPKPESPQPSEPKSEEPKPEEPKSEEPKQEEPKQDPPQANAKSASTTLRGKLVSAQDPAPVVQDPKPEAPVPQEPVKELTDEEWKERLEAEKERINKENQRKIDLRKDRYEAAKKRVAELNARFADWYYIVSDSEFQRLKIELGDLITKKGVGLPNAPGAGFPGGLPGGLPGLNIPGLPRQ
ncbi:MAG: DUF4340 domain-containing protein [Pirellula sp.]